VERARLYALLAWFHAVIQERLRYVPLGWSKHFEFTDIDASCALDVIDSWIDQTAGGGSTVSTLSSSSALKTHIRPEDIPWQALRTLLSESLYGGRIDTLNFDQRVLDAYIENIFRQENYEPNAVLVVDPNSG